MIELLKSISNTIGRIENETSILKNQLTELIKYLPQDELREYINGEEDKNSIIKRGPEVTKANQKD
jgi:hypothetical protein